MGHRYQIVVQDTRREEVVRETITAASITEATRYAEDKYLIPVPRQYRKLTVRKVPRK